MKKGGKVDVTCTCPFCGGTFGFSETEEFVTHSLPPCQKFMDMEPLPFLQAAWDGLKMKLKTLEN